MRLDASYLRRCEKPRILASFRASAILENPSIGRPPPVRHATPAPQRCPKKHAAAFPVRRIPTVIETALEQRRDRSSARATRTKNIADQLCADALRAIGEERCALILRTPHFYRARCHPAPITAPKSERRPAVSARRECNRSTCTPPLDFRDSRGKFVFSKFRPPAEGVARGLC